MSDLEYWIHVKLLLDIYLEMLAMLPALLVNGSWEKIRFLIRCDKTNPYSCNFSLYSLTRDSIVSLTEITLVALYAFDPAKA
jgi:hypothetical protein